MNRYTQGFRKFGWMEQCNDGEWVKYEDHTQELVRARIEMQKILDDRVSSYRESNDQLYAELSNTVRQRNYAINTVIVLGVFIPVFVVALLYITGVIFK